MKKEIGGKYVQVPEKERESCKECVADHDQPLCSALHVQGKRCDGKIWEEDMSEQKTALEMVDGLLSILTGGIWRDRVIEIKSAIEREQAASASIFARKETEILFLQKAIKELKLKLSDLEQSAITMRPISELPDRVPDGCAIVQCDHTMAVIEKTIDPLATHFCILSLPKPERKLHPCYMPGCGKRVEMHVVDGWYRVACQCGLSGPRHTTYEAAIKAWGWE